MDLLAEDADTLRTAQQAIKLVGDADAASSERGEGGAGDAELRKWAEAENEARVED